MDLKDLNLATLARLFANEDLAREFVESRVWPNGPTTIDCKTRIAKHTTTGGRT